MLSDTLRYFQEDNVLGWGEFVPGAFVRGDNVRGDYVQGDNVRFPDRDQLRNHTTCTLVSSMGLSLPFTLCVLNNVDANGP